MTPEEQALLPYVLPEYSVTRGWMPPDIGTQASQLNFLQDMLGQSMDPLAALLAGQGAYNPQSLFGDQVEEAEPAVTEGADMLQRIVATSDPRSPRRVIAAALLEGQDPEQAIQTAVSAGFITPEMMQGPDGKETAELQSLKSFAQEGWTKAVSDREAVTRAVPNEFVQRVTAAGYTDPRQQYTPEYIDPNVQAFGAIRGQQEGAAKAALDNYLRMRDGGATAPAAPSPTPTPSSGGGGFSMPSLPMSDSPVAQLARGAAGTAAGAAGDVVSGLGNTAPGVGARAALGAAGDVAQGGLGALEQAGSLTRWAFGMGGNGKPEPEPEQGSSRNWVGDFVREVVERAKNPGRTDAIARIGTPMSDGPRMSPARLDGARNEWIKQKDRGVEASLLHKISSNNAGAQSQALQRQGRSPFMDEYAARVAALRSLGLTA